MKPVFGYGFFSVDLAGDVVESIIFEYIDNDCEYAELIKDPVKLREEIRILKRNMQDFLDEEVVKINGEETRPYVVKVTVGLAGSRYRPFINYIIKFHCDLKPGLNTYENYYEPETAEYDYIVTWVFPEGVRVLEADLGVGYEVGPNNVLKFSVKKGFTLPGYEKISFLVPEPLLVASNSTEEEF